MAWEAFFNGNIPLALSYARKRSFAAGEGSFVRSIIENAALFGLYNAALHFDPERGIPFAPYARLCIRRCVRNELKRERIIHFARPGFPIEDCTDEVIGRRGTQEVIDSVEILQLIKSGLTSQQQLVFQRYFVDGCTCIEIAADLDCSHQNVSLIARDIRKKAQRLAAPNRIEGRGAKRRRHSRLRI